MRFLNLIAVLLVVGTFVSAAPSTQPSGMQPEDAARQRYEVAKQEAQRAFNEAILNAQKQYVADLNDALNAALNRKDVDAIRRIDDIRKTAVAALDQMQGNQVASEKRNVIPMNQSVIFLCKGAGSMIGGEDAIMESELKKQIGELAVTQKFNILLWQNGAKGSMYVSFDKSSLPATPENKAKANKFIAGFTYHGTEDPLPAIDEAFREQPQMIYFYTDGNFSNNDPDEKRPSDVAGVTAVVSRLNVSHAVQLNVVLIQARKMPDRDAEKSMIKFANDLGGPLLVVGPEKP